MLFCFFSKVIVNGQVFYFLLVLVGERYFFNIFLKRQMEYVTLRSILKVYPRYFVENSLISEIKC